MSVFVEVVPKQDKVHNQMAFNLGLEFLKGFSDFKSYVIL
jgi:hypothetical protein